MFIFYLVLLTIVKFVGAWEGFCPSGAVKSTTSNVCYTFSSNTETFIQAQIRCTEQGGNLVNVDSQFINMLLISNAATYNWDNFWIGATLTKIYNDAGMIKVWAWEGLDKFVKYDDWGFNEPSNKGGCAAVTTSDGTWFAEDCKIKKNYVCSIPVNVDVCDDEWIYFPLTRFCYKVFYHSDWVTAEGNCVAEGAHLVSVHDKQENDFVQDISHCGFTFGQNEYWKATLIGLYTTTNDNSKWNWTDGSATDYVPWPVGEPNNPDTEKCSSIFTDPMSDNPSEHWNNVPCDLELRNYVCKKGSVQLKIM